MLYLTRRPAYLFTNDDASSPVLTTLEAGTTCLLLQPNNVAAGIEYDKVLVNGKVGYIHCSLGDPIKSE